MGEFLFEILSEEIPARMQDRASNELKSGILSILKDAGLKHGSAQTFSTPRRLCLVVSDVEAEQADREIERKGPRVDAPEKAREGFLKSLGAVSYDLGETEDKKGRFLVARYTEKGQSTPSLLEEAIPTLLQQFSWPKSMRWGEGNARWVRPLHGLLCIFDGRKLNFKFAGVQSGNSTRGHRFHAPKAFEVENFGDYSGKLKNAFVLLDGNRRLELIRSKAMLLAEQKGYKLRVDESLLSELKGITEWPVPLAGRIDDDFMKLPQEVLVTSMREHQRYLALENDRGELAPFFITVANIDAPDGGKAIIDGNERVLRARLWDAKFFYDQDRKSTLESRLSALEPIVFHAKLGSVLEKAQRIEVLSAWLSTSVGADPDHTRLAARLAKTDLVTGMVGEFPELQGVIGGYYARAEGLPDAVAAAIAGHYRPQGPNDACPNSPETIAVSLADKLDTLTGFFAANIRPTGSKDPFALRRGALSIIRILLENDIRLDLADVFGRALAGYGDRFGAVDPAEISSQLMGFLLDRLAVQQREAGIRPDILKAISGLNKRGDLVDLVARAGALQTLLGTDDGENLLAACRRAKNIVRIESTNDKCGLTDYGVDVREELMAEEAERGLLQSLNDTRTPVQSALQDERYKDAMSILASLRKPIDRFFDEVMVNTDDAERRLNRLRLLTLLLSDFDKIADFTLIDG